MTCIGKEKEAFSDYLIKNSKREGRKKVTLTSSQKDWAEFYGCII